MNSETAYRHIAVIDIGKTNAKVVVLDAGTGAEIAAVRTTNSVLKSGPYPHYDIESLWRFIIDALKGFAATPGFDAISITTHGASVVLLDAGGDLALPVLDYEHIYPQTVQEAYGQVRPAFAETFSPRLSGGLNAGAQIHYQQSAFPADFARVATILTYPQYWAFRLTGVAANEMTSLGCHTDLWNPTTQSYSSLVDTLGIRALMAPVRSAFDALGPVLPALAADISLSSPVPVYCGIHDSNASLLPHLVENEAPLPSSRRGHGLSVLASAAISIISIPPAIPLPMSMPMAAPCRLPASWAAASSRFWQRKSVLHPMKQSKPRWNG